MKKMISLLTIFATSSAFATYVQYDFKTGTVLSTDDKSAIVSYLEKNCEHRINSVTEIQSTEYKTSAPEDLFSYIVGSNFEVRYLFDGTHPVTTYLEVQLLKEKSDTNASLWSTKVVGFKGLEDICLNQ